MGSQTVMFFFQEHDDKPSNSGIHMFLKKAIMYPLLFDDLSLDVVFGDTPGIQQLSLNLSNESRDFVYPGRNNSRGSMFIGLAVLP